MRITSHPLRGPAATAAVRRSPALDTAAPIHLRLLAPADAAFLDGFRVRTATMADPITPYKSREAAGHEFWFIIVAHGRDVGLVRMHDFVEIAGEPSFAWGSWVALNPGRPGLFEATARLIYRLGFGTLGFARAHLAVPRTNADLVAVHLQSGAELEFDDGAHFYMRVADRAARPLFRLTLVDG